MNRRDEQIEALRERVTNLDLTLIKSRESAVREAYYRASAVDRLAIVEEEVDRSPSDFRVISSQETRPLHQFNDPTFSWDMYCAELGRSVALGEQAYVFEVIQEAIPQASPSTTDGFAGIDVVVAELSAAGYVPSLLFAPISYMVQFLGGQGQRVAWDPNGRPFLASGTQRLEIFWSAQGRPLDRFVVADRTSGTWTVKADPAGMGRITVAIGEQLAPRGVTWLAETVVKYEVRDVEGMRSFRPNLLVDAGFQTVR